MCDESGNILGKGGLSHSVVLRVEVKHNLVTDLSRLSVLNERLIAVGEDIGRTTASGLYTNVPPAPPT